MSVEAAKEFIEEVGGDPELKEAFDAAEDDKARLAVAFEAGFEFTVAEFLEAVGKDPAELSDEELDDVAGGWCAAHDICLHGCKTKFW